MTKREEYIIDHYPSQILRMQMELCNALEKKKPKAKINKVANKINNRKKVKL